MPEYPKALTQAAGAQTALSNLIPEEDEPAEWPSALSHAVPDFDPIPPLGGDGDDNPVLPI